MDLSRVASRDAETVTDAGRQAAVVAPVLVRDGEDHVLFTKRADHLGEHPGQMSFPGGSREPSDDDLRATALREAYEEIGLGADEVEFFGRLDDIETITDYSVRPFVARIPDREYEPDEREVAEIAVLAESDLTDPDNYESELRVRPQYGELRIHFFHVDGYTVWGATGRMLVQLLELTTDWRMPAEPDRVVDPDAELPL
ncbi:NUDIX domain-containing protein [Halogeometricum rufum]|jgi:8-oxo-dGTP pyrophosphatase MutT (NUDIX family)|uniref:NUDIX domain-containing protein n=1 Tax=Halogeometricum rufum TaxID=553469 RepID=A0A1I6GE99_9EURY|nr:MULTISPECIES: CoA pyrophosphatase [Halogeometricum]MUV59145.1 NUDIX domain-containing protein [Halogeometricum sp. CBA1124]SFR40522.1 NUDIX domain-containing protein [Halogeometricum rufum]